MIFRLQDNVPSIYVNESRDFQLFCRLYDCINNGVKFDIDSMIYLFDPFKVNTKMLQLLAGRAGFFPKVELNDMMMRYIVSAFPYLVKNKGSRLAIEKAVSLVLKADNINAKYSVSINNDAHTIEISCTKSYDEIALNAILEYLIPIGYVTNLSIAESHTFTTELDNVNIIYMQVDPSVSVSQVASYNDTVGNNFIIPTYTVKEKPVNDDSEVGKTITTDQLVEIKDSEGNVLETYRATIVDYSYTYYNENQLMLKTITVTIPNNNINRHKNTIYRSEVIGTDNDTSLGVLNGNIDLVDSMDENAYTENGLDIKDYHKDIYFDDIGEQMGEQHTVLHLKDGFYFNSTADSVEISYDGRTISGNGYMNISNIIPATNVSIEEDAQVIDSLGSLAKIVAICRNVRLEGEDSPRNIFVYETVYYIGDINFNVEDN